MKTGITLGIALILFLEVCRYFRKINKTSRDIEELKEKVANIEALLKKQEGTGI